MRISGQPDPRPGAWPIVHALYGRTLHGVTLCAVLAGALSGCAMRGGAAEAYPELLDYQGRRIADVDFPGGEPFREDSLLSITETRESRCSFLGLPICVPFTSIGRDEHSLSVSTVAEDVRRLELFYRGEGYFGTQVAPSVEERGEDVRVVFAIARTEPILLDSITVAGTEPVFAPDSIVPHLPLAPGDTFRLPRFAAAADTVLLALRSAGHAYAQVLRSYGVDTVADRATASVLAVPGPRVVVDTVIVQGAANLGTGAARQQLTFREGDILRRSRLVESQRNLYGLELVQFASVAVAPDSLQRAAGDSTRATVIVNVAEAPVHQIDAALGYGHVECGRAEVRWVNRSFGGGARRLSLSGAVSKLGVGLETVQNSLCGAFQESDPIVAEGIDYRFTGSLTQPYFLSPNNRLTLTLYADRVSEPLIYRREAEGGQISLARRLGARTFLTPDVEIVRAKTLASPALYCVTFQVCEPTTIDSLAVSRWLNLVGATLNHDATDNPRNPTNGVRLASGLHWASAALGSDVRYLRFTADGSLTRTLRPGWVGAVALRLGNFFRSASLDPTRNFLPPEERFFAGGQSTVRGFSRNALGPGVYVTSDTLDDGAYDQSTARFIPVGGTSLAVASAEVRFPSPFLSELLRLAVFVDAGNVGMGNFWDLDRAAWRITPGAGLRMSTPVGPVRLDLGYNPHGPRTEPLYFADPDTGTLTKLLDQFTPEPPSFWQRLRLHLAVGQPF